VKKNENITYNVYFFITRVETDTPSETVEVISGTDSRKNGRGKKSPGVKITKLPSFALLTNMTPTFYVGGGNGVSL
jgi:hypothetical protein